MTDGGSEPETSEVAAFWAISDLMPNASLLIERPPSISPAADAFVVLDTNILLNPYDNPNSLKGFEQAIIYLAKRKRLVVPGQAVREFVRNRPKKLLEVADRLKALAAVGVPAQLQKHLSTSAFFADVTEYKALLASVTESMTRLTKLAGDTVTKFKSQQSGSDPVSEAYARCLPTSVVDPNWSHEERKSFATEARIRDVAAIPPGYKDDSDGDFLIWKTTLRVASERKTDCILVTHDSKADWFVRWQKDRWHLRPELIAEYAAASDGHMVHSMTYAEMLKAFEAEDAAVEAAELAELEAMIAQLTVRLDQSFAERGELQQQIDSKQTLIDSGFSDGYRALRYVNPMIPGEYEREKARIDTQIAEMIESEKRSMAALRELQMTIASRSEAIMSELYPLRFRLEELRSMHDNITT